MPKRGQRQPYRVVFDYFGKPSRSACSTEAEAYRIARDAAHARRNESGEARIVRILLVADDGTETVHDTLAGDQRYHFDDDERSPACWDDCDGSGDDRHVTPDEYAAGIR